MADERIVSETTLGGSGFFSRFGRNFSASPKGVGGGFTSVALGLLIVYFTSGNAQTSDVLKKLILTPAENVTTSQAGLVKITGKPTVASPLIAPKSTSTEGVIYYRNTVEEFRKIEQITAETRTVQKDGNDVQQQVEKKEWVDKWVEKSTPIVKWTNFKLANITVEPNGSQANFNTKEVFNEEKSVTDPNPTVITQITYLGKSVSAYPATKVKETVTAVPANQQLIVVGELNNETIRSGSTFIVSNKSDTELLADIQGTEKMWFWITHGLAWLLIAGGLTAILGPIFAALDILPGLGGALKSIIFIVNGVISALIVFLGTLMVQYWYIAAAAVVLLIVLLFVLRKKQA